MRLEINRVSGFSGISWIKQGWQVFKLNPSVFMGSTAVLLTFAIIPMFLPAANLFISFLMPFLLAGFYQIATDVKQENSITVADIFKYVFDIKNYIIFLKIALAAIVIALLMAPLSADITAWAQPGGERPSNSTFFLIAILGIINAMLMAFAVPIAWVAPKTSVSTILRQSFLACWQNIGAMVGYMVLCFCVILISTPVILIGWLIGYALINLSFLQAFLAIFSPEQNSDIEETQLEQDEKTSEPNESKPERSDSEE